MAEELDQLREQIARTMHDAATGHITPDGADLTPYGRMAAAVVDSVMLPLMEQVSRVAYLEARVGELHQKTGDARALAEKRLVAREDWKSRCLSTESSRQAWAEEAMRLDRAIEMMCEPMYWDVPTSVPQAGPGAPCSCLPAGVVLPAPWTPPQCAVHSAGSVLPEGEAP